MSMEESTVLSASSLRQELVLKLLVLGDLGVGKTSLVRQYTANSNNGCKDYKVSMETSYELKSVEIDSDHIVHIQLWDVPGHERFGGMTKVYYKYAHGALIVFDVARPETFESALSWLADVTEKLFDANESVVNTEESGDMVALPVVLLANKCDLPDAKVNRNKYSSFIKDNGLLAFYETSTRDAGQFNLAVQTLIKHVLNTDPSVKLARLNRRFWQN